MLSTLFLKFAVACGIICGHTSATVVETPQSQNVSAGQEVDFTCATSSSDSTIGWSFSTKLGSVTLIESMLPGGGTHSTQRFTASVAHNKATLTCVVISGGTTESYTAHLLVQGLLAPVVNLASTTLDHCTLHFTWTAPYTLQGVPINYYTINITRHSDGAVLRSDTTNTTEYLYTVSSLGETLDVEVAAVNGAGTGIVSSTTIQTPSSIKDVKSNIRLIQTIKENEGDQWRYLAQFGPVCADAIRNVVIGVNNSIHNNNGSFERMSPDSGNVNITLSNLPQNEIYSANVTIEYNGGVMQELQPMEIKTFDVDDVEVKSRAGGSMCFNIKYVGGGNEVCFVRLEKCTAENQYIRNVTINGTEKCIDDIPVNQRYVIVATDLDAINKIDIIVPFTIVVVSSSEVVASSYPTTSQGIIQTVAVFATPDLPSISMTPTDLPDASLINVIIVLVVILLIISSIIIIVIVPVIVYKRKRKPMKQVETAHPQDFDQDLPQPNSSGQCFDTEKGLHTQPTIQPIPYTDAQHGLIRTNLNLAESLCIEIFNKLDKLNLNLSTVCKLLLPIALLWKQLGEALGLTPYLDNIKTNNHSDEQRLQAVLNQWENRKVRPYTWNTLISALDSSSVGMKNLAAKIKESINVTVTLL